MISGDNLHRIVMIRDGAQKAVQVLAFTAQDSTWFGGLSFYLKDGRPTVLVAASERPDDQFTVRSGEAIRVGTSSVTFRFSSRNPGRFSGGRMCIEVDGSAGGCGDIPRMPAVDAGQGETIDVGRDTGVPVTADYPTEDTFAGRILKVVVETATQQ